MARTFSVNINNLTSWPDAMFRFKDHLVTNANWVVPQSSNGTFSNSDVITTVADLLGADRWFRMKDGTADSTGTGDSFAISGTTVTLTDAAGLFVSTDVGRYITIAGATSGGNDGTFIITAITSTTVTYENASGVTEAYTGTWTIPQAREMTFQVQDGGSSTSQNWRIKYSRAGFYEGSPGNAQTPSAHDEAIRIGGGTDASPTYAGWLSNISTDFNSAIIQIMADDAPTRGVYMFYFINYATGGEPRTHLSFDTSITSSAPSDEDPFILWTDFNTSGTAMTSRIVNNDTIGAPLKNTFTSFNAYGYTFQITSTTNYAVPKGFSVNPNNGEDQALFVPIMRIYSDGNPSGFKGYSNLYRWIAQSRSKGDTFSFDGVTKSHALFGDLLVPWDQVNPNPLL